VPASRSPVSCCHFGDRHSLLGSSFARWGVQLSLRSACRRASPPDPNGIVVLHMSKTRPGRAPPLPRGRWCAPGQRLSSARHPPLFRGQSLRPRWNIPPAGVTFTRRQQGFTHVRPSPPGGWPPPQGREAAAPRRSSPRLPPPDGTRAAPASSPGSAPRSYPQRTPGRRRANAHWPEYCTYGISRTSSSASYLNSCAITPHVIRGRLHDH
jgi:hypothetical protein